MVRLEKDGDMIEQDEVMKPASKSRRCTEQAIPAKM